MADDLLLQQYACEGSHAALSELVGHHRDWVYSAARRQLADDHLAEDVTQAVFLLLATKAKSLTRHPNLGGWLFTTLRYCIKEAKRRQIRQQKREQEVAKMHPEATQPSADWVQVAPVLDAAVAALGRQDREAVLLRFYQQKPFAEVGQSLGVSEEAARKRVDRALEKLRSALARQGVVSGSAALGAALTQRVTQAAPPRVADSLAHVLAGTADGTPASAIAQGAAKMAQWTKVKALACAAMVLVLGALAVQVLSADARPPQAAASSAPAPANLPAATPAPAYLGWVRVETVYQGSPRGTTRTTYLNTRDSTVVRIDKTTNATYVSYISLATGLRHQYNAQTGQILIGEAITPDAVQDVWIRPVGMAQVLARAKAALGTREASIAKSRDGELEKWEITSTEKGGPATRSRVKAVQVWFDPAGRVRRYTTQLAAGAAARTGMAVTGPTDEQYAYDEPGPADIYAAGAPRDAEVIDARPDPATMAVLAKVRPIIRPTLGDHTAIWTQTAPGPTPEDSGLVSISGRSSTRWFLRQYEILAGQFGQQFAKKQPQILTEIPVGWPSPTPADLLDIADARPGQRTAIGDGSAGIEWKLGQSNEYERSIIPWVQRPWGPFPYVYPMDWQLFGPDPNTRLTLVTDDQHPGLLGISIEHVLSTQRRTLPTTGPSTTQAVPPSSPPAHQRTAAVLWVDPAQGHRPVLYEQPIENVPPGQPAPRQITRYEHYETLPGGILYPSLWSIEYPPGQNRRTPAGLPAGRKTGNVFHLRIEPGSPDPKWFTEPTP